MKKNEIFYNFLNVVAPEEKSNFRSTDFGYETFNPINKAGVKVSYYTKTNSITVTRPDKVYVGGMYEDRNVSKRYGVEELEDRLRFIPKY